MTNEAAASLVVIELIFITRVIKGLENRKVEVLNIPGAFFYAKNYEDMVLFLKGKLKEMMAVIAMQVCQRYNFTRKNREKFCYVKVQTRLHRLLKSALFF